MFELFNSKNKKDELKYAITKNYFPTLKKHIFYNSNSFMHITFIKKKTITLQN